MQHSSLQIHSFSKMPDLPAYAGGARPLFEDTREGFRLTLPLDVKIAKPEGHSEAGSGQVTGQVDAPVNLDATRPESRPESELASRLGSLLAARVIIALFEIPSGKAELAKGFGNATVSGELKKQIQRLQKSGLTEMTLPDKPNSRLQKYRLSATGRSWLDKAE